MKLGRPGLVGALCVVALASVPAAIEPDIIQSSGAVAPHVAGRFRDPRGFQQATSGQVFVFDRRAHTVYGISRDGDSAYQIVQIGAEPGRIIGPTAFSLAPDGSFAVADAPDRRGRVQLFNPIGFRIGGFALTERARPRVTFENAVLNGIASMHYTGSSILISQPEDGALVTEYTLSGQHSRTFGRLRATGNEHDPDVHLALNSGIPLADPRGGFYFVFLAGMPVFQKFDQEGRLLFERRVQGPELDTTTSSLPATWPRRDDELPLVTPVVRAAAVDRRGQLWISLAVPFTYVYDEDGDKVRVVQFRGRDVLAPTSLFFAPDTRLLVTPGLYEFDVEAVG